MEIRKYIYQKLSEAQVEKNEITAETNFIIENLFNIPNPYMDFGITQMQREKLDEIFEKRYLGYPLQYILGISDFMGEKFFVDENVLIPRQETELLVIETVKKARNFKNPKILDIGTGSGCIAIMLAKKFGDITSCDISKNAIEIAKKNADKHSAKINFIESDIFSNIKEKFNIIVSNPPYIPKKEKPTIQKEVSFEPDSALYTSDEFGIEFYERIIKDGKNYLNNDGFLLFELGINQSELVKKLFEDYNYKEIEIIKDLNNIDRVILAKV